MALIKCDECGRDISDKAVSCPGCGCPVAVKTSVDTIKCEECGKEIDLTASHCPECGFPKIISPVNIQAPIKVNQYEANVIKSEAWGIGILVCLILVSLLIPLLGTIIGIYGLCNSEKKGQGIIILIISIFSWLVYGVLWSIVQSAMSIY